MGVTIIYVNEKHISGNSGSFKNIEEALAMKNKWVMMGIGAGVGTALLLANGLSAMAGYSGYDAYKEALKNTKAMTSVTGNIDVLVRDNGAQVLKGDVIFKKNNEQQAVGAEMQINSGSQSHAVNVFHQDNKTIVKTSDSDVYKVIEQKGPAPKWKDSKNTHVTPEVENVIDAMVGNLRDSVTVDDQKDGSQHVSLHLSGTQIPAAVNALGSLVIKKVSNCPNQGTANPSYIPIDLPKLTQNIHVQEVNLDADINANHVINEQTAEIKIVGQDAQGAEHTLNVKTNLHLSAFNQTALVPLDLKGKKVEVVQHQAAMHHGNW
jgi:hypothetical protein